MVAGVDVDSACRFPFESNIDASFLHDEDVVTLPGLVCLGYGPESVVRLLADAPRAGRSRPYRRGADTSLEKDWPLLTEFGRLVAETGVELVTMENVPRLGSSRVFANFVADLRAADYHVSWRSCYGPDYGLAQGRRRLVLLASRLGPIEIPAGRLSGGPYRTVRDEIGDLPALSAGASDRDDRLHRSRALSEMNLRRIRASTPGGTWQDWPEHLRAPCHRKPSGGTFRNVYARMEWDSPSPTITTLAHNFGTGRFGHPQQDRPISLREAGMLQGFPQDYRFVREDEPVFFTVLGRLIGNAVPPPIAEAVGTALVDHVAERCTPSACARAA